MIGQILPFPLYSLFVFRAFFGLCSAAASSLIGSHDLVLVSVVPTFFTDVILPSVKFFSVGLRVSLFVHAHSMWYRSTMVPQSASARNPSNLVLFSVSCDSADCP